MGTGMENNWYCAEAADRSYGPLTIQELGHILRTKVNSVMGIVTWEPSPSLPHGR